ncbi:glycosyl hydrolase [Triangularia setosa]|uniref:Glycosyl hydrolase n=1 Tax=Triangularia setosa TaxID=2587417 RepID=A0AAN7A3L9_9PEZI|nr:glycosyl hydrolase [Podospora setosa]
MRLNSAFLTLLTGSGSLAAVEKPYSTWLTDSIISYNIVPKSRWYTEATFYYGVEAVHNHTSSPAYLSYLVSQADPILTPNGSFVSWDFKDHQLDNIRIGSPLLYLYTQTSNVRYRSAIDFLHDRLLNHQKRTPAGGFWHKDPKYPNQMWLDGLFMAGPFSAAYAALFDPKNITLWDDILLQFQLIEDHCRNTTKGNSMLKHGYDELYKAVWADPVTGASPLVWIRAQGWYFMALLDVLDWFPTSHEGYKLITKWFKDLAKAVKREQDESGGWWLVMDEQYKGKKGNYIESSGTAMYTYGILKGIRKGLLEETEYFGVAEKAYKLMAERFVARNGTGGGINWEGTVRVGSLDGKGDYEYYIGINKVVNDLKGVGPFILASVEWERHLGEKNL